MGNAKYFFCSSWITDVFPAFNAFLRTAQSQQLNIRSKSEFLQEYWLGIPIFWYLYQSFVIDHVSKMQIGAKFFLWLHSIIILRNIFKQLKSKKKFKILWTFLIQFEKGIELNLSLSAECRMPAWVWNSTCKYRCKWLARLSSNVPSYWIMFMYVLFSNMQTVTNAYNTKAKLFLEAKFSIIIFYLPKVQTGLEYSAG